MKKVCSANFAKFTGKHLCQSLFFNKVADLRLATLLKNRLWHRCFPVNFVKFVKHLFYRTPLGNCLSQYKNLLKQAWLPLTFSIYLHNFSS